MRILVLGCKGQLGRCLTDQLRTTDHEVIYTSREQINVVDFEDTKNQILKATPDLIINATAYTAVDKAEEDKKNAEMINHLAVKNVADICSRQGCWLIHVSTDYVFDGTATVPYREDDQTNPQGVYGETKHGGELAIQASGCRYVIIRTAWLFSEHGDNFLKTMLRLGAKRNELNIVGDQVGCPTYGQDVARAIVIIASQLNSRKGSGIYHYCGHQPCSWYDFAKEIFNHAKEKRFIVPKTINSINTSAYPTPAKRPAFSVLDCSKIEKDFGVYPSSWLDGVGRAIKKLSREKSNF